MAPQAYSELANWNGLLTPSNSSTAPSSPSRAQQTRQTSLQDDLPTAGLDKLVMLRRADAQDKPGMAYPTNAPDATSDSSEQMHTASADSLLAMDGSETRGTSSRTLSSSYDSPFSQSLHDCSLMYPPLARPDEADVPAPWKETRGFPESEAARDQMTNSTLSRLRQAELHTELYRGLTPTSFAEQQSRMTVMSDMRSSPLVRTSESFQDDSNNRASPTEIPVLHVSYNGTQQDSWREKNPSVGFTQSPSPTHAPTRASSVRSQTGTQTNIIRAQTSYASLLDEEMSVVPETPDSSPAPSLHNTPEVATFAAVSTQEYFMSSHHDARERAREATSEGIHRTSTISTTESNQRTLVETTAYTALQEVIPSRPSTPFRRATIDEIIPESPLSSLTSLSTPEKPVKPKRSTIRQHPPAHRAYVLLPTLPASVKEKYKPMEIVMKSLLQDGAAHRPRSRPRSPSAVQARGLKRKRSPVDRTNSTSDVRPHKKPSQHKGEFDGRKILSRPRQSNDGCKTRMRLDASCYGGDAKDPLEADFPYIPVDVDTSCESSAVFDRSQDWNISYGLLYSACRYALNTDAEEEAPIGAPVARLPSKPEAVESMPVQRTDLPGPEIARLPSPTSSASVPPPTTAVATTRNSTPSPHPIDPPLSHRIFAGLKDLQGYGSSASPTPSPKAARTFVESNPLPPLPSPSFLSSDPLAMQPHIHERVPSVSSLPSFSASGDGSSGLVLLQRPGPFTMPVNQALSYAVRGDPFIAGDVRMPDTSSATLRHNDAFLGPMSDDRDDDMWAAGPSRPYSHDNGFADMQETLGPQYETVPQASFTIDPSLLGGPPEAPPDLPFSSPSGGENGTRMDVYRRFLSSSPSPHSSPVKRTPVQAQGPPTVAGRNQPSSDSDEAPLASTVTRRSDNGKGKERAHSPSIRAGSSAVHLQDEGKEKGKGKDRPREKTLPPPGKPREFFAWAPDVNNVASELSESHVVEGKRARKPAVRLRQSPLQEYLIEHTPEAASTSKRANSEAYDPPPRPKSYVEHSSKKVNHLEEKRAAVSTAPDSDSGGATADERVLVEIGAYCHQCRNRNRYEKMRCTNIDVSGNLCGLLFCQKCIILRYPNITFDAFITVFSCPKCSGICNCTACCARRGETYVSTRGQRVNIELPLCRALSFVSSARAKQSLAKGKQSIASSEVRGTRERSTPKVLPAPHAPETSKRHDPPVPLDPSLQLPQGAVWGTVYSPMDGERLGRAVVVKNDKVVLHPKTKKSKASKALKARPIKFIGAPRPGWIPLDPSDPPVDPTKAAFIGSQHMIYKLAWYLSQKKDEEGDSEQEDDEGESSDLTPVPPDVVVVDDVTKDLVPEKPADQRSSIPTQDLAFLITDVLEQAKEM